jgi:hypothetical protein
VMSTSEAKPDHSTAMQLDLTEDPVGF